MECRPYRSNPLPSITPVNPTILRLDTQAAGIKLQLTNYPSAVSPPEPAIEISQLAFNSGNLSLPIPRNPPEISAETPKPGSCIILQLPGSPLDRYIVVAMPTYFGGYLHPRYTNAMATSTPPKRNSWYIIHFKDDKNGHDILHLDTPTQSLTEAANGLKSTVLQRFGQLSGYDEGGYSYVSRLGVLAGNPEVVTVDITFSQLVTYIRDLPPSGTATKPNLFGLGGNRVKVEFGYTESELTF